MHIARTPYDNKYTQGRHLPLAAGRVHCASSLTMLTPSRRRGHHLLFSEESERERPAAWPGECDAGAGDTPAISVVCGHLGLRRFQSPYTHLSGY